jgi:outer membrane protein TolC
MRARRFILVVVCALSLAGGVCVLSGAGANQDQTTAALEEQLQELLHERVKTAQRAMDATQAAFEAQTVTLLGVVEAANKLVEAKLAIATTGAQRIEALEQHLQRAQQTEQKIEVLYKVGARGGEAKEHATAKRERQSAEIALIQAQLKARQ